MSCGEYGDNIKNLVTAIKNGKYDIRSGYALPETKEVLNNMTLETKEEDSTENNIVKKDMNDAKNVEEKFQENKTNETGNGNIIPGFGNNDIVKQSTFHRFFITGKCVVILKNDFCTCRWRCYSSWCGKKGQRKHCLAWRDFSGRSRKIPNFWIDAILDRS